MPEVYGPPGYLYNDPAHAIPQVTVYPSFNWRAWAMLAAAAYLIGKRMRWI
jgi:hypothetical protein